MGLFKKLKNFVTGGSAEVTVEAEEPRIGAPFTVRTAVRVGDEDCKVGGVYLRLWAEETVEVPDVDVARRSGKDMTVSRETVRVTTITYDHKVEIAPAQVLKAGREYDWETTVELPEEVLPTYEGPRARHSWKILAGLDTPGNDPDSGWTEIAVY